MTTAIQYLKRNEIDIVKWDNCISGSENGLIYSYSWYLDSMAENWDALVLNNYEAVMPLTWKRKYGFYYLYQPFFTASLGLFANTQPISIADFLRAIPSKFTYWDIDTNEAHIVPEPNPVAALTVHKRLNLFLDLKKNYSALTSQYSRLAKRSLEKSHKHNLAIVRNDTPEDIITFYRKSYHTAHPRVAGKDYHALLSCCNIAARKHHLKTYTAHTPEGEAVAFYIVLYDNNFVYSLVGGSTAKGKSMGAFYLLTDAAIQDQAGANKIFRFEGSDISGIAFFNRQFGSVPVYYDHLKMNRLPFPVKCFKK